MKVGGTSDIVPRAKHENSGESSRGLFRELIRPVTKVVNTVSLVLKETKTAAVLRQ